jgi:transcription elongation GreA/GreB family factor
MNTRQAGAWPARMLARQLLAQLQEARAATLRRRDPARSDDDALAALVSEIALLDAWIVRLGGSLSRIEDQAAGTDWCADEARPGSRVELRWDDGGVETLLLCTPLEWRWRPNWVSPRSAMGRALLGKRPGDTISLPARGRARGARVLTVR